MGRLTVKERLALEGIRQIAFVQVAGARTVVIGGGISGGAASIGMYPIPMRGYVLHSA